ncbi:contractile injection system protein, VgrG/Pvc8 family [uncultured Sphingomonas sp.]|uniref:contractile injection system protein, VgrG/Pvc8 family n=1 Tax=uncultured Sphingomonas sp. TaxID=158754 RepID=UPI0025E16CA0|nr:contractile injection system protein, VgrG/Pvc8 family [uncultured Sphingomonas sp.]
MSAVPDFRVTVDGRDITDMLRGLVSPARGPKRARLVSLGITSKRGGDADQLDLVLDDSDGALAFPPTDAKVRVWLGWKRGVGVTPGLIDMGEFVVDELGHTGPPDLLTIRARSADFTGSLKTRRDKSWNGTTLGAIVREIAGRHGLKPACAPALARIPVATKAQSRESDLAFLRRLGREHDAAATIKGGALILSPIGAGTAPSGAALPAVTIRRADGDRHDFGRRRREEAEGAEASWHDRSEGKRKTVTAGKAAGAKKLGRVYGSEAEAQRAAGAAAKRAGREPVTLSMTLALGRADLQPEQRATVEGLKREIADAKWLIAEVAHALGDRGFTTSVKLEAA